MTAYDFPMEWKNKNDLAELLGYDQHSYECEIGCIDSTVTAINGLKQFTLDTSVYGESATTLQLAGMEDPHDRRVVWFPCGEYGTPLTHARTYERYFGQPHRHQPTSERYDSLLSDFLHVDWNKDASVLAFYEEYGPLWADRLFQSDLRIQSSPREKDGKIVVDTVKRGESLYMAKLQAELVGVLLRIFGVLNGEDGLDVSAARNLAAWLSKTYGIEYRRPYPHVMLFLPTPGGYSGWGAHVSLGNAANPDCPQEELVNQLQWVATYLLDEALSNVVLHMDRLTHCDRSSQNYGVPVLQYRPKNLMTLILLQVALIFTTKDKRVGRCPACGHVFFPQRSNSVWHKNSCRMKIERALGKRGKGLSAEEKVRLYQRLGHADRPHL